MGRAMLVQGGSNMTGTNCDLFTHNQSRSYLNHLVHSLSACFACWGSAFNFTYHVKGPELGLVAYSRVPVTGVEKLNAVEGKEEE